MLDVRSFYGFQCVLIFKAQRGDDEKDQNSSKGAAVTANSILDVLVMLLVAYHPHTTSQLLTHTSTEHSSHRATCWDVLTN